MKCKIDPHCKAYKAYILRDQAVQMKGECHSYAAFQYVCLACRGRFHKESLHVSRSIPSPDTRFTSILSVQKMQVMQQSCLIIKDLSFFRRLLFTSDNVIQHELGEGEVNFKWHKQSKQQPTSYISTPSDDSSATSTISNARLLTETTPTETSDCSPAASLVPHTSAEQARMRATIAGMMSREVNTKDKFVDCSSVFIEPIEWIGQSLLGSNEGKVSDFYCLIFNIIITSTAATVSEVWITIGVLQLGRWIYLIVVFVITIIIFVRCAVLLW